MWPSACFFQLFLRHTRRSARMIFLCALALPSIFVSLHSEKKLSPRALITKIGKWLIHRNGLRARFFSFCKARDKTRICARASSKLKFISGQRPAALVNDVIGSVAQRQRSKKKISSTKYTSAICVQRWARPDFSILGADKPRILH